VASRRRGRAAAELELAGAAGDDARVRKVKLDGLVSCRESRRCYWSTGSQEGGGVGG
jgi:hypothetical protein